MDYRMTAPSFELGIEPDHYIESLRNYRSLVKQLRTDAAAAPIDAAVEQLRARVAGVPQAPVRATLMTEDWCGDSACNLPILAELFARAGVEFRVFRGSEHRALQSAYHARSIEHIPVCSLWDGAGAELAVWIERPAACAPRADAWKAAHPQFMRAYHAKKTDKAAEREFASLYRDYLEEMAGWYRADLWVETAREVAALLI